MRRFELSEDKSSKFWEIEQQGTDLYIRWGRIGTTGQSQTKSFADATKAAAALGKLIAEKTRKGYQESQAVAPQSTPTEIGALAAEDAVQTATTTALDTAGSTLPPWLTQGQPILLTPQMQARVWASRRFPQPVPTLGAQVAWYKVKQQLDLDARIDVGCTDAALRAAVQRLPERLQLLEPAPDTEADCLLLARTLVATTDYYYGPSPGAEAVVDWLVARYGLPQAVDIWLATQRISVERRYDHHLKTRNMWFTLQVDEPLHGGWSGPLGDGEGQLRRYLSVASEAEWQDCAARMEAALPSLHPTRQPVLALLLPDRPDISNALLLRLGHEKEPPSTLHWLLLTATDAAAQKIAANKTLVGNSGCTFWGEQQMVATLVQERGVEAVAILESGAACDETGEALAAIGTPEAIVALAKTASSSKATLARLSLALNRWPLAGIAGLARCVAAGGKDAGLLNVHLTGLLRAHADQTEALRPWLDSGSKQVIDRLVSRLNGTAHAEADVTEWPEVLRNPPWQAKAKKSAPKALALQPLALPAQEQWPPGVREATLQLEPWSREKQNKAKKNILELLFQLDFSVNTKKPNADPLTAKALVAIEARNATDFIDAWRAALEVRKKENSYFYASLHAFYIPLLPTEIAVAFWNAVAGEVETWDASYVMASLGLPALPGLQTMLRCKPTEHMKLAQHFAAVELAAPIARAFAKLKSCREAARLWLLSHPEYAACGLIAPALGKAGEARYCATAALHLLHAQGHTALLQEVASRYGNPAVTKALQAVLDENPLDRFPGKITALPDWWQPGHWSPPLLHNGKALPPAALQPLGQMLTFPTHEEIYPGLSAVQQACQQGSLADFAWDACNAWLAHGAASKENWALTALGLLGNDNSARRLTPLIRAWPGEAAHARAVVGVDVLANIGTDVALMQLNGIAQKLKFKGLQDKAREKIQAIAQLRGLTPEELEDRLVPDLGLDHKGSLCLDFGPRAFVVGFDESLKPYVRELDAQGRPASRLPDLPKAKKTDDAELAKAATERFKSLKKDARTIASQQVRRLEIAMCQQRRWTADVFRLFLVEHPLVRYLVQRLIWGVYVDGQLHHCFRVAEDGSYTTAEDDPFVLPDEEQLHIGLPHALELSAADSSAFGQLLADYELLQPFAQLGRDTYQLTAAEQASTKLERWKGSKVPTGRVLGLVNKGWRRGMAQDAGCIWYFLKPLGSNQAIELALDPGIIVGMVNEDPEQQLGSVTCGLPSRWDGGVQTAQKFSKLDAIAASELIRDMEALCA